MGIPFLVNQVSYKQLMLKEMQYLMVSQSPFSNPNTLSSFWYIFLTGKRVMEIPQQEYNKKSLLGERKKKSSSRGTMSLFFFAFCLLGDSPLLASSNMERSRRKPLLVSGTFCPAAVPTPHWFVPCAADASPVKMEYLSLQDLSEKSPETLPFSRWQGKSSFSLKMNISMQNLAFSLPHFLWPLRPRRIFSAVAWTRFNCSSCFTLSYTDHQELESTL